MFLTLSLFSFIQGRLAGLVLWDSPIDLWATRIQFSERVATFLPRILTQNITMCSNMALGKELLAKEYLGSIV